MKFLILKKISDQFEACDPQARKARLAKVAAGMKTKGDIKPSDMNSKTRRIAKIIRKFHPDVKKEAVDSSLRKDRLSRVFKAMKKADASMHGYASFAGAGEAVRKSAKAFKILNKRRDARNKHGSASTLSGNGESGWSSRDAGNHVADRQLAMAAIRRKQGLKKTAMSDIKNSKLFRKRSSTITGTAGKTFLP